MKVICLIEVSGCLVKNSEVAQKYISELTELKKNKDYMQPDKNLFLHFLFLFFFKILFIYLTEITSRRRGRQREREGSRLPPQPTSLSHIHIYSTQNF
uniref:Uncharacterized protein n=1 Tax=Neovison vison TaxID=452646 RepID=A0A8C7EL09_NEOVI